MPARPPTDLPEPLHAASVPGLQPGIAAPIGPWQWLVALLLPLVAVVLVQWWALRPGPPGDIQRLAMATGHAEAKLAAPGQPPVLTEPGAVLRLPLRRSPEAEGGHWVRIELPPPDAAALAEPQVLALAFQPALAVYLDGVLLARSDAAGDAERFALGLRRMTLDIPPALRRAGTTQTLLLHLAASGPSGARLEAPLLGPREAVLALDQGRRHWQALRAFTAIGGLLVGVLLALVALVRRGEPLYALSAAHVALLALLLAPYVLPEQPLPSPWWRALLDVADLAAKALLVAIAAQLAGRWGRRWKLGLWALVGFGATVDLSAAWAALPWSDFSHPWPWWALGSRALLLGLAWWLALRALGTPVGSGERGPSAADATALPRPSPSRRAAWGTALLVGFSTLTWAWVSLAALVLERPVVDANALAHAGWVVWVAALLLAHFSDSARREVALRRRLSEELQARTAEMQGAFAAQAAAERERATAEQRRRLLQDLHDGLGAQLLNVRLRAAELPPEELAQALDACLLEMRLSVDALAEAEGELGVLLGGWRQRVEPMLAAAGLRFDWRVRPTPPVPALQGAGALELVRLLQEVLANTIRHARASVLIVATEQTDGSLRLWLADDGTGLPESATVGQGRRGLVQRAERLAAKLAWHSPAPAALRPESPRGPGTAVELRLPLAPRQSDDA
jgi:signal transduction histidine kinase